MAVIGTFVDEFIVVAIHESYQVIGRVKIKLINNNGALFFVFVLFLFIFFVMVFLFLLVLSSTLFMHINFIL